MSDEREEPPADRVAVCDACGGDGGFETTPHTYNPATGEPITYWQRCRPCGGTGELVVELQPITLEDLETLEHDT